MSLGTRDIARLGLLVAVAATLQVAEGLIPKPVPWLRLGLANGLTLLVLGREGLGRALAVAVTRVLLARRSCCPPQGGFWPASSWESACGWRCRRCRSSA